MTIMTLLGPLHPATIVVVAAAASTVTFLCVVPLIIATLRGAAHPSPVTWGIWAAVGAVATVGMARGGAPTSAWLLKGALSSGPVFVMAASLLKGEARTLDRHDRWSLALGAVGTVVYFFTGTGMVAVATAMTVDAVGGWPTLRRIWLDPYGELIITYALALASVIAVLETLPLPWTWLGSSYLVFLAVQMAAIIATFLIARRRTRQPDTTPPAQARRALA